MSVNVTPFLRNALILDAVASGATALLMVVGGSFVAPITALPAGLLFWAGLALLPFVALLVYAARQPSLSRMLVIEIIAVNALWVVGSFGILAAGLVQPNLLGVAFVAAQALAVTLFAVLQMVGLRKGQAAFAG